MADVCRDAVEFLRPLWTSRRRHGRPTIAVRLRAEPGLLVQGEPTELREVITNLLKNALDALADGGDVSIRARRLEGVVQVTVQDNGPGMDASIQARVFEPFFTTKGERGTGLGLCLSQQIVDRHGGDIHIESRLGAGSTIRIELPETPRKEGPGGLESAGSDHPPLPSVSILVVDDDEKVRQPLSRYLEQSGYEVCSAPNGLEAAEAAHRLRPDLVISDVAMPDMDGLELCRRLRRELPGTPVILMSGRASSIDPSRARRAGAAYFLRKPFALQEVADLIRGLSLQHRPPPPQRTLRGD
jgi:CheY-like chemotaxis protein